MTRLTRKRLIFPGDFGFTDYYTDDRMTHHGTQESQKPRLLRGIRTEFGGTDMFGPAFYTTDSERRAWDYARRAPGGRPIVVSGYVKAQNPVAGTRQNLIDLGREFRRFNPHIPVLERLRPADLGNIALRQADHDVFEVLEDDYNVPAGITAILRPKAWEIYNVEY